MVLRRWATGGFGAAAAALVAFSGETGLALWAGVPCNGAVIAELQRIATGWGCVDRFGFDPVLAAAAILVVAAAAAVGAFVGVVRSASRGAAGTTLGLFTYGVVMNRTLDVPLSSDWLAYAAAEAAFGGVVGYFGAWIAMRCLPSGKRPAEAPR